MAGIFSPRAFLSFSTSDSSFVAHIYLLLYTLLLVSGSFSSAVLIDWILLVVLHSPFCVCPSSALVLLISFYCLSTFSPAVMFVHFCCFARPFDTSLCTVHSHIFNRHPQPDTAHRTRQLLSFPLPFPLPLSPTQGVNQHAPTPRISLSFFAQPPKPQHGPSRASVAPFPPSFPASSLTHSGHEPTRTHHTRVNRSLFPLIGNG